MSLSGGSNIEILSGDPIYKYQIIGSVEVSIEPPTVFHDSPTVSDLNVELIKEARRVNADAVIRVLYVKSPTWFSWGAMKASGIAVKK